MNVIFKNIDAVLISLVEMVQQKISQSLTQALVVTNEVKQSLDILQLSTEDLLHVILSKYSGNPFLEVNYSALDQLLLKHNRRREDVTSSNEIEFVSVQDSLKEHLLKQIGMLFYNSENQKKLAIIITDCVDDNGYLTSSAEEIGATHGYSANVIASTMNQLKKLEPTGVYAENLEECLRLQCVEECILDEVTDLILKNLQLVASGKLKKLAAIAGVSFEKMQEALNKIKRLNPKPGLRYSQYVQHVVIPEVYVKKIGSKLIAIPNDYLSAIVSINQEYLQYVSDVAHSLMNEQKKEAIMVVKAVSQRQTTLLKVVECILQEQYEFFISGVSYLKPMTLSKVANTIAVHESTVSRLANKMIATDGAFYTLKYFFNSSLKSHLFEDDYSSGAAKEIIRKLIKNENHQEPYSDSKLATLLQNDGIQISRRTIAKYREFMKIASSSLRKRAYSL